MNQKELADTLTKVNDQIQKGIAEVIAAIASSGNTSTEVDTAVAKLQAAAQSLDDLNPDAPVA